MSKFISGLNGAFCGVFRFYESFYEGQQDKTKTPRWGGLSNTTDMIVGIIDSIDAVTEKINDISHMFSGCSQLSSINLKNIHLIYVSKSLK